MILVGGACGDGDTGLTWAIGGKGAAGTAIKVNEGCEIGDTAG